LAERMTLPSTREVVLLIGSNIDPVSNIKRAIKEISRIVQINLQSSLWETKPIGTVGNNFFNLALSVTTSLDFDPLKFEILRNIEIRLGRVRISDKYAPRTIDIDIILYGNTIIDINIWNYAYIAVPVAELVPSFIRPDTNQTLEEVAEILIKNSWIKKHPATILQ
jgi:2-amino-4-hydroxy-6-hydroxymethyldihydropteridine diphosphokinase